MKEVLLFLAAVVVPIMLVGAMYKQRLCKRSDWMRGAYAEGFLDYVESTAAERVAYK